MVGVAGADAAVGPGRALHHADGRRAGADRHPGPDALPVVRRRGGAQQRGLVHRPRHEDGRARAPHGAADRGGHLLPGDQRHDRVRVPHVGPHRVHGRELRRGRPPRRHRAARQAIPRRRLQVRRRDLRFHHHHHHHPLLLQRQPQEEEEKKEEGSGPDVWWGGVVQRKRWRM